MNQEILFAFVAATTVLSLSPGPDNIYVLVQSITHGKKYGLATVVGLVSGCLVHTALLAFGVSALIKANDNLFFIIKLFGAIYLGYLAFGVYSSSSVVDLYQGKVVKKSLSQLFKQGFVMNVLNPKVTIFFLAFFPGFLFSKTLGSEIQFFVLGGLFMLVTFFVFGVIAVLAGSIASYLLKNKYFGVILKWLQIVVFIAIAFYLLFSNK